jgi:preprotein translocase SecE subunit
MPDQTSPSMSSAQVAEPSRGLAVYKPGQGYYTRMGTVVGVALVSLLGIIWMWEWLKLIPIGTMNPLYVAASGAILVGGAITAVTYYLVFLKPSSVDFLIATEGEMKKVNWSTRREIVGSTTAVIIVAVILALFCWGLELFFVWFFQLIKVLEG